MASITLTRVRKVNDVTQNEIWETIKNSSPEKTDLPNNSSMKKHKIYSSTIDKQFIALRRQLNSFRSLAVSDALEEPPSALACNLSFQILEHLHQAHCYPALLSPSPDGGILFEFSINHEYILIEIYNSGELVYFKRSPEKQREAYDYSLPQLLHKIATDLVPLHDKNRLSA